LIIPYFTDNHISGQNSENRIGNYYSDSMAKLEEILQIAKKNDCPFILCGGDLLDSPIISLTICDEIIDLIEKYKIPIYTLVGNHPMINHNYSVSQATTIAHMFRRCKFIKKLETIEDKDYLIQGIDYQKDIETIIKKDGIKMVSKDKRWTIVVVHALITPKAFLPVINHIQAKDVDSDYDLVLCGHLHQPFIKVYDDVTYVNPGSIGRTSIDEADIAPSVVLLDTDKRSYKIIKLKSAKPKEEIFDLTKIEQKKEFNSEIELFISSLQTTTFTDLDLVGVAKEICKRSDVDKEVEDEVISRITNSENKG